jgi:peptide deformylase
MKLKIAQLGQPVLWQVAAPVPAEEIPTASFQLFLQDMRETLLEEKGAGLAAPQVFARRRIFLAAIIPPASEEEMPGIETFINPRLVHVSAETRLAWEGCLSFPELLVLVERSRSLRVEYLNEQGQSCVLDLADFPARVIQHEFDHLEGILTLDRAPSTHHIIKTSEAETVMGK